MLKNTQGIAVLTSVDQKWKNKKLEAANDNKTFYTESKKRDLA